MAQLIAGYGTSHTGMTIRKYDPAIPAQARVHPAFDRLAEDLAAWAPDLIVMVSSEHLNSFFYESYQKI